MLRQYGIKQILNKRLFLIMLVIFILISLVEINNLKLEDFNNRNIPGLVYSEMYFKDMYRFESFFSRSDGYGNEKPYMMSIMKNAKLALENNKLGNYIESYRNEIMVQILEMNVFSKQDERKFFEPIVKPIWEDICPDIKYPDNNGEEFGVPTEPHSEAEMGYQLSKIRYLYNCYKLGIPYVEEYSANNMIFLYNIMNKIIPVFIILFILLLFYTTISEEHRIHVSRNILSQPIKRQMYLRERIISNMAVILPTIIILIILMCLFSAIYLDSHSMNMPILTTNNQWNTFTHKGMNLKESQLSLYNIFKLGPTIVNRRAFGTELFDKVIFLPFWKVILIYSFEMFLFVIFILGITIYVSAMTNKKSISMGISIGIIGGLYLLYKIYPQIPNPILAIDTSNIITGASNFTLLSLTLIQITFILIVFLIGNYLFNKKDISY